MKIFDSRLPETFLNSIFLAFYLTEKTNCIKELCQKSFENILNYIMWNSACMQENIISASVKTQIKLFPLSPAMLFTLRSILHVKYSKQPLEMKFPLLLNTFLITTRQLSLQYEQWWSISYLIKNIFINLSTRAGILCLKRITLISQSKASHSLLQRKEITSGTDIRLPLALL